MIEELVIIDAVGHIAIIAAVLVQASKRRRIHSQVNRGAWQLLHHLNAIAVVDRVAVGDLLLFYSQ